MRFLSLLFSSALLVCGVVSASEKLHLDQSEQLKEGLVAMRQGDKTKAWELLFPQAQAGDVQAMFYLGEMMVRSPEYEDHLERAVKFFTVAAAKGHAGAKEMLPKVKEMLVNKQSGGLPTIGGASGVPTPDEIEQVNRQIARYKSEVLRFTNTLTDTADTPRVEVMFFLSQADAATDRLYRLAQGLEEQFGNKIKTSFIVVINPSEWKPDTPPIGGTSVPPSGFTPDFQGQMAAQHGITRLPAVVLLLPSGQSKVVTDLSSLSPQITSLL